MSQDSVPRSYAGGARRTGSGESVAKYDALTLVAKEWTP